MICLFNFLIFLAVCLNISTEINIKILANSNQQTQSYKFNSHIAAFLYVVLITEMLEICIQTLYDQNVQLILKSYFPVVYGTTLIRYQGFYYYHLCWRTISPDVIIRSVVSASEVAWFIRCVYRWNIQCHINDRENRKGNERMDNHYELESNSQLQWW